jgi:FAD/FMN-containing dehydrogenase
LTSNGLLDRRPALAVSCATRDDVRRAVEFAQRLGLPVCVRGGGHSFAGHGIGDGALLINLAPMRRVTVDPVARVARIAGGAIWNDVDPATHRHRLAVPGGTFGDTGVGGLTLGGGIGWLIGTAGLSCDNLVGAEVVTVAGEVVTTREDGDAELLWALRGGGGNFGIVTSFELALHERGPMLGGHVTYRLEDTAAVLRGIAQIMREAPEELTIQPALRVGNQHGKRGCVAMFAYAGPPERGLHHVDTLRSLAEPSDETVEPMSYLQVQAMNELLPFGLRHYWSGHFVSDLEEALIDALCGHLDAPGGLDLVLLEPLHGRARSTDPQTAAFPAREARWNVTALAVWDNPGNDREQVSWAKSTADAVAPWSLRGGGYVNYAAHDEPAHQRQKTYGHERWERLRAVKRRYDPDNLLRFNANITP